MCSPLESISRPGFITGRGGWMILAVAAILVACPLDAGHALQQPTLTPGQAADSQAPAGAQQQAPAAAPGHGQQEAAPAPGHGAAPAQDAHKAAEPRKGTADAGAPAHEAVKAGEHAEEHGAHGPALPEISPIPGVTFVETMIKLMEDELQGRFLGWRPNDMVFGKMTDNINNYQLGVLEAIRFTTFRLKDSLTRMGDADTYDPDLELALNLFMNRATLFWFPSAETSYEEAVDHLKRFVVKLKAGQRNFYPRIDNIRLLLTTYKDLLGNVNKGLIVSPVSWFKVDDYFYYAKGMAHVLYELLRVVRVMYENQLKSTLTGLELVDEIIHELYRVEEMDPWIILDSDLDGLLANHRANMNAPLSEVAHIMGILSSF